MIPLIFPKVPPSPLGILTVPQLHPPLEHQTPLKNPLLGRALWSTFCLISTGLCLLSVQEKNCMSCTPEGFMGSWDWYIYLHLPLKDQLNVGKYTILNVGKCTIHGSYGYWEIHQIVESTCHVICPKNWFLYVFLKGKLDCCWLLECNHYLARMLEHAGDLPGASKIS